MNDSTCSTPGCACKVYYKGQCHKHYVRVGRPKPKPCSVDECETTAICRGLCDTHYTRWRRHGDPGVTQRVSKIETDLDKRLRWYGWTERTVRPEIGACWEWNGCRYGSGYGQMSVGGNRHRTASRVAFDTWVRPLGEDEYACHRCDNPPCINPAHLFAGSRVDNMQDASRKARTAWGERQGAHKLTESEVWQIWQMYHAGGYTYKELGKLFGVSRDGVGSIIREETWRHLQLSSKFPILSATSSMSDAKSPL